MTLEDVFTTVLFIFDVVAGVGLLILLLKWCSKLVQGRPVATPTWVDVELMPPVVPVAATLELGYFPYSADGRRVSEKLVCAICLEVFEHGEECSEVPDCQHLFHRGCIAVWMKSKTSCPLCRCDIVQGSERVSAADDMV